ncbi:hypothetical protein HMPREF9087_0867 [Enterococcus casseliflavus ATCC 12755]|uniref:Uncharacterized protein n=1 Tax=Enterococcus casseliflavus ATCC 12755 TaxID=888066 RepID=F0EHH5_ENTCA|nr:hypothetical protein HMPREF9087_0867 [Enterococcus casseliflavus ATCC 12755]EPH93869.1 hypothetical protein D922_01671 [Enterococcus faecalis 06-MB-DW-09]OJG31869.1 hypothetical protein RU99_GL002262 [Enterococcus casseliflavus]
MNSFFQHSFFNKKTQIEKTTVQRVFSSLTVVFSIWVLPA